MTHGSKPPCGSTHDYTALSLPPPYRIVNSASCSTSSETEAPQTTAKAESFPQPLESFHLEASSIGRKETQSDTYTDISNNDVAGVSSNFGEMKDIPSIQGDPPLQKADSLDLRVYTRITESPALYGQGHHLDDKLDAESKSSSDEKTEQTAENDEKHNFIIEKVDNMHRVEDGEGNPEVRFSEMKVPWNPMHNIPMVVMDADGEPQALSVIVDTGAACSLIPDEVVRMLKLKKHPIQAFDRQHPQKQIQLEKFYSPLGGVSITPTHFVNLKVKGHRIGLDKYVDTHVRVLETENAQIPTMSPTDIVFGMPFIMRNNVFQRFLAMPRDGNPFYVLLKGKQSDAQKTEDQKVKEEDRTLAEHLDRTKSSGTASQRVATSTVTRDHSDTSMRSWDRSRDWQSGDSSNTSQAMASGSGKDFYEELEDVSSHQG